MIRLTRRYRFSAAHRLHSPALSAEENKALYGKCNYPYGHGHDYLLEVSVRGPVDEGGRAVDLRALDRLVSEEVIDPLDHTDLNRGALAHAIPTTENLAVEVRRRLSARWAEFFSGDWPRLDHIRIDETKRNHFELPG